MSSRAASILASGATPRSGSTSSTSATIAATRYLNQAQPYEAFTDVVNGIDPGRDNTIGTADDKIVQVYSVPRSYPTFGQVKELTVNAAPGEGDDTLQRVRGHLQQELLERLVVARLRTSADHRDAKNIDPRNPNEALYGIGTTGVWALPETYQGVRLSGTYELPWQMLVAIDVHRAAGRVFQSRRPGARCAEHGGQPDRRRTGRPL